LKDGIKRERLKKQIQKQELEQRKSLLRKSKMKNLERKLKLNSRELLEIRNFLWKKLKNLQRWQLYM
jgi:hypothetical protein